MLNCTAPSKRNKAPDWEVFLAWEKIDRGRPPAGSGDVRWRFRNQNEPKMPAMRRGEENATVALVEEIRRTCLEKLCLSYPRCLSPEGLLDFGRWSIYIAIMSYLGRWDPKIKLKFNYVSYSSHLSPKLTFQSKFDNAVVLLVSIVSVLQRF